jgi:hypothetical protein
MSWVEYMIRINDSYDSEGGSVVMKAFLLVRFVRLSRIASTHRSNRLEGVRLAEQRLRSYANARFKISSSNIISDNKDIIKYKKARTSGLVFMMNCKRAMLSLLNKILHLRRDLWLRKFVDCTYKERRSLETVSRSNAMLLSVSSDKTKKAHLLDILRDVVEDKVVRTMF